jgi:hypothetical protein
MKLNATCGRFHLFCGFPICLPFVTAFNPTMRILLLSSKMGAPLDNTFDRDDSFAIICLGKKILK